MYSEHGFILLFLAITVFLFVRAYNHGVANLLWGVAGVCAGLAGGWLFYGMIPDLFPEWEAGFRTRLFLSALVGAIPYLIVRFVARALISRFLNPSSPVGFLADGVAGGMLSLIPSLITIIILITCVRVAGTRADLQRFEKLSIDGVDYRTPVYPKRPMLAEWRDGVERLPLVMSTLGALDRVNRVPERRVVGLLITSKKEELFDHLTADSESRPIVISNSFAALLDDPEIARLNESRQHFTLLQHEQVRAAAFDPAIRPILEVLELHRLVDEFMLSPERQSLLESLERR